MDILTRGIKQFKGTKAVFNGILIVSIDGCIDSSLMVCLMALWMVPVLMALP